MADKPAVKPTAKAIDAATPKAGIVLVQELPGPGANDVSWKVLAPFTIGKFGAGREHGNLKKFYTLGKGSVDEEDEGSIWKAAIREFEEETGISMKKMLTRKRTKGYGDDTDRVKVLEVVVGTSEGGTKTIDCRDMKNYDELLERIEKQEAKNGVIGCQQVLMPSSQGYMNRQHLFLVKVDNIDLLAKYCKAANYAVNPPSMKQMTEEAQREKLPDIAELISILRTGRVPYSFYKKYNQRTYEKGDNGNPDTTENRAAGVVATLFQDPLLPAIEQLYFRQKAEKERTDYSPRQIKNQQEFDAMFEWFSGDNSINLLKDQMAELKRFLRKKNGFISGLRQRTEAGR